MMMMKKQKPATRSWTKFGWALLALMLTLAACKQSTEKQSNTDQKAKTSESTLQSTPNATKDKVYTVVEKKPEFKGGVKALIDYLGKNIKYPEEAKKNGIQGKVFINFIVEKDGSISHVKVLKGIGHGCDKEAVRVVSSMPKWIPGEQQGEPVRVSFNLPIKYALN